MLNVRNRTVGLHTPYSDVAGFTRPWPFEPAFLQSAIIKPEAIGIPKENFDFITATVTEDEPCFTERIHVQYIRHNQRQAINGFAHIGDARDQVNSRIWCQTSQKVVESSQLGKAVKYTVGQWPKLVRYIEDGHLSIDNNRAERADYLVQCIKELAKPEPDIDSLLPWNFSH